MKTTRVLRSKSKKHIKTAKHYYHCLMMAYHTRKNGGNPYYFEKQAEITGNKLNTITR